MKILAKILIFNILIFNVFLAKNNYLKPSALNNLNSISNTIIVENFTTGELEQFVENNIDFSSFDDIEDLTINNGQLNKNDLDFINFNLPSLVNLQILSNEPFRNTGSNPNSLKIPDNAFNLDNGSVLINLESIRIDNVEEVGKKIFNNLPSLKEVIMPNLRTLDTSSFENTKVLKYINKDNNYDANLPLLAKINSKAFNGSAIGSINLEQVEAIEGQAFNDATSLRRVFAPNLKRIHTRAFRNALSLQTMIFNDINFPNSDMVVLINDAADEGKEGFWFLYDSNITFYVDSDEKINTYLDNEDWEEYEFDLISNIPESDEIFDFTPLPDVETEAGNYRNSKYYKGNYKVSLNLYTFNYNLNIKDEADPRKMSIEDVIDYASSRKYDAIDLTLYYVEGYDHITILDSQQKAAMITRLEAIKAYANSKNIAISGVGIQNNFLSAKDSKYRTDIERLKAYLDIAKAIDAPFIRIFAGAVPSDYKRLGGWDNLAPRLVNAVQEAADYAKANNIKTIISIQNHGDFLATAEQTIKALELIDRDNVQILNDTGYFRFFKKISGEGYDWYKDIGEVLNYSNNIQVKKKPGGADHPTLMDLDVLFTELRYSNYDYNNNYVSIEMLWAGNDNDHPSLENQPPYEQADNFYRLVKKALSDTKMPPHGLNNDDKTYIIIMSVIFTLIATSFFGYSFIQLTKK